MLWYTSIPDQDIIQNKSWVNPSKYISQGSHCLTISWSSLKFIHRRYVLLWGILQNIISNISNNIHYIEVGGHWISWSSLSWCRVAYKMTIAPRGRVKTAICMLSKALVLGYSNYLWVLVVLPRRCHRWWYSGLLLDQTPWAQ